MPVGRSRNLRLVVQEIMRQVIAHISKDSAAEDRGRCVPIIEEDSMCEFPEGSGEGNE